MSDQYLPRILMLSKACIVGIYQRKLEEIARLGIDLLTLVPPSWKDERGETRLERVYTQGYQLQEIPIRLNGNFHLHHYPTLGEWVQRFRPDIIHIDEEPYNAAAWQALYEARRVRAKSLFFSWQNIKRGYPPPFSWGERWVLRNVDTALAGTESAAQVWREKGYTKPMAVVPQFGTDPTLFTPAIKGNNRDARPFTIGYVGRLVEEKGIHLLLQAVAGLTGDWKLRLIGSGPYKGELMALAERLGIGARIEWVEWVASTEMPAQYHLLDVLVIPSLTRPNWKEQFGRVITEAMSSGVPVVGSDSGAIPNIIGEAGLVVPEGNTDALREALDSVRCKPDLRARLAEAGRERVLAHYTHEQVAADTVRVYREMMD
ncbi:MAG: glycosyltransferase family 4 protein [Chloroflexi bacterium]|nr:glycosyltransferase family 4 protein [Chloroflexota bacterium]MCC6896829.1 glycosyltransferase family 4 protein [Anaerolineae bacterium]